MACENLKADGNFTGEFNVMGLSQGALLARSIVEDVEFSCEDATRSDREFVAEVVGAVDYFAANGDILARLGIDGLDAEQLRDYLLTGVVAAR